MTNFKSLLRVRVLLPALATAILAVIATVGHAGIRGPNGVISACLVPASGTERQHALST
jgi:hypothetical protein